MSQNHTNEMKTKQMKVQLDLRKNSNEQSSKNILTDDLVSTVGRTRIHEKIPFYLGKIEVVIFTNIFPMSQQSFWACFQCSPALGFFVSVSLLVLENFRNCPQIPKCRAS